MTASCRRRQRPSITREAGVPMIVAINKMDKPDADPNRVRTDLLQHEVIVESMGGDVLDVEVSALKGTNLDKLLEAILLQAELLDLKANPDRPPKASWSRPSSTRAAARSPPCWCSPARSRGRHRRRRRRLGPCARADQRPRRAGRGGRPVRAGRDPRHEFGTPQAGDRSLWSRAKPAPARSPNTASASCARRLVVHRPRVRGRSSR
jgi:hypothetical protein